MKAHRRTAALLASSCSWGPRARSDPDEAGDDGGGDSSADDGPLEGSTVGLTDDTIKIGYLGADFGALAEIGLAPDLGDQSKIVQSVVDEINDNGGIGGRQIELKLLLVDGTAGPEVGQAACIEMTEDFGAFAVILGPAMSRDIARCTAVTNETLTIELAPGSTRRSTRRPRDGCSAPAPTRRCPPTASTRAGRGCSTTPGSSTARPSASSPPSSRPSSRPRSRTGLAPHAEELGHEVAVNVNLPAPRATATATSTRRPSSR